MNPSPRIGRTAAGLLACLLVLGVAVPSARAQSGRATVSASLVDPSVDAGETAEYHVEITNGSADQPPPPPQVPGLSIAYVGPRRFENIQLRNFQVERVSTTTYIYQIKTSRAGRFTIPGQQLDVGGTTYRTLPVTLTVLDAGGGGGNAPPGQTLAAELILPRKSAYVGEGIPAELHAFIGVAMRLIQVDPDPVLSGEGFSAQKFTRPRLEMQNVEGEQMQVLSYKTALAGVKTGTLTVGPVEVQPVVRNLRVQQRRRGNFADPFDDPSFNNMFDQFNLNVAPPKQVKLRSGTVNIEIKPLPPGKPADFSGAIGEFKLEAEAEPRKAQAGDPVTVRLLLSGRGNFDRIAAPVLSDERGLKIYPASGKFKADDDVNLVGVKTFEQVVIADGRRSTLPPYRFTYLNPETGKYVTLDTPPVPVEIVGGTAPTPGVSAAPVAVPAATPTPTPPPRVPEDILYIRNDFGPARTGADFLPPYRRRAFWVTQGSVLLGLLGVAALGGLRARARNEKARQLAHLHRRKAELQRALREENTGRSEFYSAATEWARLKAAVAAGQPAGSLSVADICRVNGLDMQAAAPVEEIFHRHDELAYSGALAAREPVPAAERRGVLATLETLEKR